NPTAGTLIQEIAIPEGIYSNDFEIILDKPVFFAAGEFIAVYAIPDVGYNVTARMWDTPFKDQPNPNARHNFIWNGGAAGTLTGWGLTTVASTYAYHGVPLRLYSNVVTQDQLREVTGGLKKEFAEDLRAQFSDPRFVLPSRVHAVVGTEFNLYYDAITLLPDVGDGEIPMLFDVVCAIGAHDRRSFRVTPTAGQIGSHALTITAYDNRGNVIATKATTLTVVAAAGLGTAKKIIGIGDSTTDDTGVVTKTLQEKLASFGGVVPTFLGLHGVAPYNMEARTGSTLSYFA
ncbi:hypothetical protein, partial [Massilia varians]|uniref:hypothetical protein n=1 Tax=Massilia varians TaxID=457921 RepID=UPI00361DEBC5